MLHRLNRITRKEAAGGFQVLLETLTSSPDVFLADRPLTAGQRKRLRNNDSIALVETSFTVFNFFDCLDNEQTNYPGGLRTKCTIINKIGEGSFGEVMLALSHKESELRAVKKVAKDVKGLKNEVELLKTVKHRCIIPFYDVEETDDNLYIVMGYANGGEIPDRRLSEKVRVVQGFGHVVFIFRLR